MVCKGNTSFSIIYLIHTYLLSMYHVPSTCLSAGDTAVNKSGNSCPPGTYILAVRLTVNLCAVSDFHFHRRCGKDSII